MGKHKADGINRLWLLFLNRVCQYLCVFSGDGPSFATRESRIARSLGGTLTFPVADFSIAGQNSFHPSGLP